MATKEQLERASKARVYSVFNETNAGRLYPPIGPEDEHHLKGPALKHLIDSLTHSVRFSRQRKLYITNGITVQATGNITQDTRKLALECAKQSEKVPLIAIF